MQLTKELFKKDREYLDILGPIKNYLSGISRSNDKLESDLIKEITVGKYAINALPFINGGRTSDLLTRLEQTGLKIKFGLILDKLIGNFVQNEAELDKLLKGLALSAAMFNQKDAINTTVAYYKSHPVLIVCRILELSGVKGG